MWTWRLHQVCVQKHTPADQQPVASKICLHSKWWFSLPEHCTHAYLPGSLLRACQETLIYPRIVVLHNSLRKLLQTGCLSALQSPSDLASAVVFCKIFLHAHLLHLTLWFHQLEISGYIWRHLQSRDVFNPQSKVQIMKLRKHTCQREAVTLLMPSLGRS